MLDFGQTEDGLFYLIMELVAGRTLDKLLERERKLPAPRVVRIGTQICDALEGAHARPIAVVIVSATVAFVVVGR